MKNAEKIALIEQRLAELKAVVEGSLNLRAVGGAHVINELFAVLAELAQVKKAVAEAEVGEEPAPVDPTPPVEPTEPEGGA